jgi:hypothetical protein
VCFAHWTEHVIATNGEPYLRTPDDVMFFAARYPLDVYAMLATCCSMVWLLMRAAIGALIRKCKHIMLASMVALMKCKHIMLASMMALMNAGFYVGPKSM